MFYVLVIISIARQRTLKAAEPNDVTICEELRRVLLCGRF